MIGPSLAIGAARSFADTLSPPDIPPTIAWRNIARTDGPGNDNAVLTGGGNAFTHSETYDNESGTSVSELRFVMAGWRHRLNEPDELVPQSYSVSIGLEYPLGSPEQTTDVSVNPGELGTSATLPLSTAIPAGAAFRVHCHVPAGTVVPKTRNADDLIRVRVAGVLARHARANALMLGDSIVTNHGKPAQAAAKNILPLCQLGIIGSTGFENAPHIARRVALAQALGVTHMFANYGANDHGSGRDTAQLRSMVTAIGDAFAAAGIQPYWATVTPKARLVDQLHASDTQAGVTRIAVTDGDAYAAGEIYTLSGASDPLRNGPCQVAEVDGNSVAFRTPLAPDGPDTVRIEGTFANVAHQEPDGSNYAGGAGSRWARFNEWLRTRPGSIAGVVDVAQALAAGPDDSRWRGPPLDGRLIASSEAAVRQVFSNNTRIRIYRPAAVDSGARNWMTNGTLVWLTGAKAGQSSTVSGMYESDYLDVVNGTSGAQAGDRVGLLPFRDASQATYDGLHPAVAFGYGGARRMQDVYADAFRALVE